MFFRTFTLGTANPISGKKARPTLTSKPFVPILFSLGTSPGSKEEQIGRKRLLTARSCAFASGAKEEDSSYSTGT